MGTAASAFPPAATPASRPSRRFVLLTACGSQTRAEIGRRFPDLVIREEAGDAEPGSLTVDGDPRTIEALFRSLTTEAAPVDLARKRMLDFDTAVFPAKKGFWPARMVYGLGIERKQTRQEELPPLSATPAEILRQR